MISELDETIRKMLISEGGFAPAEIEISFEIPNREWSSGIAKPTINCYLFDIRENQELRQSGMRVQPGANSLSKRLRAPLRLDLTYLITAWTRAVEDEHRLLWHTLRTLMRFSTLPGEHLQGALGEQALPIPTRIAQADGVLKSPGEFWTALENQLKPSLNYVVTLAADYDGIAVGPPVLTTTTRLRSIDLPGDDRLRIGGLLRDERGEPVAGAQLSIDGHGRSTTSDADGRFILRVPQAGDYSIVVRAGETAVRRDVRVPSPDYTVTLQLSEPPATRAKSRRSAGKGGDRAP